MPKDEEGGAGLRAAPSYGELDRKKEEWVDTPAQTKRIVILGGGFGGLYAALYLDRTVARDPGIEVILIDPQNFALFTPMLHEVAAGTLDPSSIVVPIRQALRHVQFLEAEASAIDFAARTVTIVYGLDGRKVAIRFEQLLIAVGSQTRFPPGLGRRALGMKTIHDALLLRNWLIGILERAEIETDAERRRAWLTIVVAGGGFSGVETVGAINDFLRDVAPHYRRVTAESLSIVLIASGEHLLPEFEPALGRYAESKLREAGIDVRLQTKVADFDGRLVSFVDEDNSRGLAALQAHTLIWTAGITPPPLIESLPLPKERGRIVVTGTMALPGYEGVWACGDCALIPDASGKPYPTTAQHAIRQGTQVGRNIAAAVRMHPDKIRPFRYKMLGQLAAIGRQRGVASIFGLQFSGFLAWLLWRSAYLIKLPSVIKKLRVMLEWTLDLCFPRDTVQLLTIQSVRSGRLDELIESAREADSTDAVEADPNLKFG
jgi:NADH dehydrogenase